MVKAGPRQLGYFVLLAAFAAWVGASYWGGMESGRQMGRTFTSTFLVMLKLLPCAFVLIGLFDVWVKRETVEQHFGRGSGLRGYLWSILLAGMTVGGLYIAFPVAYSLFRKGAHLPVVFAYVSLAGVCRIPMTLFEISFMGVTFTAVRLAVSIPLVIFSSWLLGRFLEGRNYAITE